MVIHTDGKPTVTHYPGKRLKAYLRSAAWDVWHYKECEPIPHWVLVAYGRDSGMYGLRTEEWNEQPIMDFLRDGDVIVRPCVEGGVAFAIPMSEFQEHLEQVSS